MKLESTCLQTDQPLANARQQLTQLIKQIKENGKQDNLLPTLQTVLTQLESLTKHDQLTGALNRRALLSMLDSELARSYRTGHTFSFAVISVDHLEKFWSNTDRPLPVRYCKWSPKKRWTCCARWILSVALPPMNLRS
jgi:hypothetical protein